jgi:hypothetical protein
MFSACYGHLKFITVAVCLSGLLSCQALNVGSSGQSPEQKQINKEAVANFEKSAGEILAKLPPSARIVVPEFEAHGVSLSPKFKVNSEQIKLNADQIRDRVGQYLVKQGVQVVNRAVFKHAEQEIVLSQTGVTDSETSIKVGKAAGATHVVLGKYESTIQKDVIRVTTTVKVVDTESHLLLGVAILRQTLPPPH